MSADHQRTFSERIKKILVVTADDRILRVLDKLLGKILPSAQISSLNPKSEPLPHLDNVDLMVLGLNQQWPGAIDWLAHHAVRRMPPIISIDASAEVGTAVSMMQLGVVDYIDAREANEQRLIKALMRTHSDIPAEEGSFATGEVDDQTAVAPHLDASQQKKLADGGNTKQETGAVSSTSAVDEFEQTQVLPMPNFPAAASEQTGVIQMPDIPAASDKTEVMPNLATPAASERTGVIQMPDLSSASADQKPAVPANDPNAQTNVFSGLMDKLSPAAGDNVDEGGGLEHGIDEEEDFDAAAETQLAPHLNATPEEVATQQGGGKTNGPFSGAWLRMPDAVGEQDWPFSAADMEEGRAKLGGYRILDFLGVGGMASVFKAQRMSDDALFAIKLLNPTMADDSVRERFVREYGILHMIHHKHVVKMEEQVDEGKWIYTVMEYLPGGDLKSRIRRRLKREQAVRYASQIAAALQAAHKVGVLHRDLKPANVLFRTDGTLALVDFGVAKATQAGQTDLTKEGQMVGTPYYASPEQATGGKVDQRSDLYALGVILFEMLEGRRPFVGDTSLKVLMAHVKEPVPLLSQEWDNLNDVLSQLLAKSPDNRLPDGAAVVHALEESCPGDVPRGLLEGE